jgi:hypothetical protein
LQTQRKTDADGGVTKNVPLFGRHKTNIYGNETEIGILTTKDVNDTSNDMEQHFLSSNKDKIRNIDVDVEVIPENRIRTKVLDLTKACVMCFWCNWHKLKRESGASLVYWVRGCRLQQKRSGEAAAAGGSGTCCRKISPRKQYCDSKMTPMKLHPLVHDAIFALR